MNAAEPPNWYAAIREQVPVERRTLVAFVDFRRWAELIVPELETGDRQNVQTVLEMLGLANATAMIEVWGLDGESFVNKTFLALDGEPRGLLRLISDRPLKPEDLASIPRDATTAMAFRLDLEDGPQHGPRGGRKDDARGQGGVYQTTRRGRENAGR